MTTRVKRGPASARTTASRGAKQRRRAKARAQGGSAVAGAMAWLPVSEAMWHRVFVGGILALAAAGLWLVAVLAGVPALATGEVARLARAGGFVVHRVDVRGLNHLDELQVYERVLGEQDRPMPLVDVRALRANLLQLSWVKDARVSRQWPDRLIVDVIERAPRAALRTPQAGGADRFTLVDETGHLLEDVPAARAHQYPIISGDGVGDQVGALAALLRAAPALRHQVAEAQWIGHRRWNLAFRSGQVLVLPEGGDAAATALNVFARLDGTNRLLGGRVASFDMRAADRIYLRVPGRAAAAGSAPAKNTP